MSENEKKEYLKLYRLQQPKIDRAKILMRSNPAKRDTHLELLKQAQRVREKIESEIESVDDNILREILFSKYVLGLTLENISESLCYSKRQIERLHKKALTNFNIQ